MRLKQGIPVVVAGMLILTLAACRGGGKEAAVPEEYIIGGEQVSALAAYDGVEVTQTDSEESDQIVYIYEGVSAPGAMVKAYADQQTEAACGFSVVDENYYETDAPDYGASEGAVYLARAAEDDGKLLLIELEWTEEICTVTTAAVEGVVEEPKSMMLFEKIDYFCSILPENLGLPGASMEEYTVYALDGIVLVDSQPCLQLSVYSKDNPEGTNELMGRYLMNGDGSHIYRLDAESKTVKAVSVF